MDNSSQLKQFFLNSYHPQSTLYSCGPAVIKMVANYFRKTENIFGPIDESILTANNESFLSALFKTNEKEGTDFTMMTTMLNEMGCLIDHGQIHNSIKKVKSFPLHFKKLLKEGIPIVVNYTYHLKKKDPLTQSSEVGHFGVIYGVNDLEILIYDPAEHFKLNIAKEKMTITEFLGDWKSGNGEIGIYLILYPNEHSYERLSYELHLNKSKNN
ncbi:MAG: C39 family peptidase [Tatlockia sp.]|nr:C39 family peptidase [Tatlockia sp.]